ncbi:MAG: hypothetical protein HQK58_07955 [Deltaproteobacteria bacterium]|nr:hypothetical protein [Deltaproteobacteria bacterium]
MIKIRRVLAPLVFLIFLLVAFTGFSEGNVIVIDGLHLLSIVDPFLSPDYTAYLKEAIPADQAALIEQQIGPIAAFKWSRNIYDTDDNLINSLSQVLADASQSSIAQKKPFVILTHSWGTVLAYLALRQHPDIKVDKFITLGSPLDSMTGVIKSFTEIYVSDVNILPNVREWNNYWIECDPISGVIPVATHNIELQDNDKLIRSQHKEELTRSQARDEFITCHEKYYSDSGVWNQILSDVLGSFDPTRGVWIAANGKKIYFQTYTDGGAICIISANAKAIITFYAANVNNGVFDGGDVPTGGKTQHLRIPFSSPTQADYTLTVVASNMAESSKLTVDSTAEINSTTDGIWQATPDTSQMFYFQRYTGGGAILLLSSDAVNCEVYYDPAAKANLFSGRDIYNLGTKVSFVFATAVSGQVSRDTSDGKKTTWNVNLVSSAK